MAKSEREMREFVKGTVEGYLNGCYDCGYEPMTKQEWLEYIWNTIEYEKGIYTNGVEPTHFYFLGKETVMNYASKYLDTYKDVQKYIVK